MDFDECYELIERYLNNRKRVDKDVMLSYSPELDLSDLVYVGGYIDLFGASIEKLPSLEHVEMSLDIQHSPITELPKLEYIGEDLHLFSYDNIDISHIEIKGSIIRY